MCLRFCWYAPTSTAAFLFRLRFLLLPLPLLLSFFLRFSSLLQLLLLLLLLLSVLSLITVCIFSLSLCILSVSTVQTSPSPFIPLFSLALSLCLPPRPFLRARLQPYSCLLHSCLGLSAAPVLFRLFSTFPVAIACCAGLLLISNHPSTPVPSFFTKSPSSLLFFFLFFLSFFSFLFLSFFLSLCLSAWCSRQIPNPSADILPPSPLSLSL